MSVLLGALILLPGVVGMGCCALRADVHVRVVGALALGVAAVTAGLAVVVALTYPQAQVPLLPGRPIVLGVDALSAALVLTVAVAALLVVLFTTGSPEAGPRLFGLLLMFTAAMLATVTAENVVTLLVAWELMGAASYALIGHNYTEQRRVSAGTTAFLTTRTADVGLYVAAGAALAVGTSTFADVNALAGSGWAQVIAAGVVVAALGKSAQLPFSGWLSAAMLGPSPVSALLHSATMVAAGGYLLLRLHPLLASTGWALPVAWVGAITGVVMGAVALVQRDLKQLLAASTCAQIGFVVLAAGTGAIAGGVAALMAHAATKALLFLCAGTWLDALGTKDIEALRGVGRRYPAIGVAAGVGALSLAGVPPLALWVGKDAALAVAAEEHPALYGVGLVAAVLSAAYGARVLVMLLARPSVMPDLDTEQRFDTEQRGTRRVSLVGTVAVGVLAVAAAGSGLLGFTPARDVLGGPWASPAGLVISGVLAVTAACVVVFAPAPTRAPAWLHGWVGTTVGLAAIGSATLRLADVLARVDDRGVSGVVDATARATLAVSSTVTDRVEPRVAGVATGTAAAARRLGALARRPQTGQLHTYYAQAVTALVVLAVLIALVR